jgi:hypothetical protein
MKHYQCMMVRKIKAGERGKPLQVTKCTSAVTNDNSEMAKTRKVTTSSSQKKEVALKRCRGTLKGIYSIVNGKKKHQFTPGQKNDICYNMSWAKGNMADGRVPFELILPPMTWNITQALMNNVKESLSAIKSN